MIRTIHRRRFWFYFMGLYESMEIIPAVDVKDYGPIFMDIAISKIDRVNVYKEGLFDLYFESKE